MELNLTEQWELSIPHKFKFALFFNYSTELIRTLGTFKRDNFKPAPPLHPQNWTYPHIHTQLDTCWYQVSITVRNWNGDDLGWGKQCHRKQINPLSLGKKWAYLVQRACRVKPNAWTYPTLELFPSKHVSLFFSFFFKSERFWSGHDECFNLSNAWTNPTWTYQAWIVHITRTSNGWKRKPKRILTWMGGRMARQQWHWQGC